jgi:hypothetical protein
VTGDLSLNEQTSRRRQNALQKRLDRHRAGIIQARADLAALVFKAIEGIGARKVLNL